MSVLVQVYYSSALSFHTVKNDMQEGHKCFWGKRISSVLWGVRRCGPVSVCVCLCVCLCGTFDNCYGSTMRAGSLKLPKDNRGNVCF